MSDSAEYISDSTETAINWETCPPHALPAMLQTSLDSLHLKKLNDHSKNVERLNYELKHVLNYVASEFKKHKASKHGEKEYPYSLKPNNENSDPSKVMDPLDNTPKSTTQWIKDGISNVFGGKKEEEVNINDAQLSDKMRHALDEVERLYSQFYNDVKDKSKIPGQIPNLPEEFKPLFKNKEAITPEEIENALSKIDEMQRENKDEITKIAENIQLLGHLYTTITEITRKMQDSHLRFIERTAEKMGSR